MEIVAVDERAVDVEQDGFGHGRLNEAAAQSVSQQAGERSRALVVSGHNHFVLEGHK
jgi:hypothetical protein